MNISKIRRRLIEIEMRGLMHNRSNKKLRRLKAGLATIEYTQLKKLLPCDYYTYEPAYKLP